MKLGVRVHRSCTGCCWESEILFHSFTMTSHRCWSAFSKLCVGFLVSQLQKSFLLGRRPCKPTCCREFFAMRSHVEHPVVSVKEFYSKHKFKCFNTRYTHLYGPVKQTKNMNMMNGACGFARLNDVQLLLLKM